MKKPFVILLVLLSLNSFAQLPSDCQDFVEKYYNAHVVENFDYLKSVFPEHGIGWYGYHGKMYHGHFPYFSARSNKEVIRRRIKTFKKEDWTATKIAELKVLKKDESSILITYMLYYWKITIKDRKTKTGAVKEWMIINSNGKITNIHDNDISEYYTKQFLPQKKEGEKKLEDEEKIIPTKYEGLLQLAKLKEKGLLSEEEFDKEKRKILDQSGNSNTNAKVEKTKKKPSFVDMNIPANKKVKDRYALVIGNEDYSSSQRTLSSEQNVDFAVNDATVFKQYCLNTLGVKDDNMFFITNATAGKMNQEINRVIEIISALGNNAELIFYYAGHGYPDELTKVPYLIPVDISGSDLSYAIKLNDLYKRLSETNAKQITMFLDACFTGGGRTSGLVASRGVKVKPKEGVLNGNIVVFSASSGEQSALPYSSQNHGVFTYHLLKNLKDSNGSIKYGELFDKLEQSVNVTSLKENSKKQNPKVNTSSEVVNTWRDWKF